MTKQWKFEYSSENFTIILLMMNIFVHSPFGRVRKLLLGEFCSIGSIELILKPDLPLIFLYKSTILEKSMTLNDYSVKDGDHIFCTPYICRQSLEFHNSFAKFASMKTPQQYGMLKKEYARMTDVALIKIDSNFEAYRKIIKSYKILTDIDRSEFPQSETIIPAQSTQPNNTELPKFW